MNTLASKGISALMISWVTGTAVLFENLAVTAYQLLRPTILTLACFWLAPMRCSFPNTHSLTNSTLRRALAQGLAVGDFLSAVFTTGVALSISISISISLLLLLLLLLFLLLLLLLLAGYVFPWVIALSLVCVNVMTSASGGLLAVG